MTKKTLNLGCGDRVFTEYPIGHKCVNYDLRADLNGVDVVGDVEDLSMFKDEEFDYIMASDIIEHFPIFKTIPLLKEWNRVLKHGGSMEIRTPNMEWVSLYYSENKNAEFVSYHIFGGQDHPGNYHYVIFDPKWLSSLCEQAGFMVVSTERPPGSNFILKVYKK